MRLQRLVFVGFAVLALGMWSLRADEPTSRPAALEANDVPGLKAAIDSGKLATVDGTIAHAAWSKTGAVMNMEFVNSADSKLMAVIFAKSRDAFDAAFPKDAAVTLAGAHVRLTGKITAYGGKFEAWKDRPQIILTRPSQIEILDPAPATAPAKPNSAPAVDAAWGD